jgi:hypothetical protein
MALLDKLRQLPGLTLSYSANPVAFLRAGFEYLKSGDAVPQL